MSMTTADIRLLLVTVRDELRAKLDELLEAHPDIHLTGAARSGPEALTLARRLRPDLVLVDLPAGDEALLGAITRLGPVEEGPYLLILTDQPLASATNQRAIQLGVSGLLHEEDLPFMLIKAIRRVCEGELWFDRQTTANMIRDLRRDRRMDAEQARLSERAKLLSAQERAIVTLVGAGLGVTAIARRLVLDEISLRNQLGAIYAKLGVSHRVELMQRARQLGLTS